MSDSSEWRTPDVHDWSSGDWTLQVRGDELADLTYAGRTVLRSVRAVVRDRNWDTAGLVVDRVRASDATLTLHVRSEGLGSSFRGVVRVEARAGRLVVLADLESAHEFATNRTGLVILHPSEVAGESLRVAHSDGSTRLTSFPRAISPHQPVFDVAALSWRHAGLEVAVAFDGDVFEMEDQRNWSDASFKTYSRPLDLPFPYAVAAGERVRQSVRIDVREVATPGQAAGADVVRLSVAGPVPEFGLGAATAPDPSPTSVGRAPSAVLVELDLRTPNWRAAIDRAARSGAPLDVRVIAPVGADFDEVARALAAVDAEPGAAGIVRVGAFEAALHVTDAAVLAGLHDALDAAGVDVPVIGGSRAHFTELNREWGIIPRELDGVAFSLTPLFHSLGTEQLIESVPVQRIIATQAVELADGLPVHVGPVTLRPRFNDVATSAQPLPTHDDLGEGYGAEFTGAVDPRQSAHELAAWTVASAAALAVPGVASVAYFEEWGDRGIRSSEGEVFPVAAAMEALGSLRVPGARLLWGGSTDGLVWAIGARCDEEDIVLVANLDAEQREITVLIGDPAGAERVGPTTVRLEPFAFSRVARAR